MYTTTVQHSYIKKREKKKTFQIWKVHKKSRVLETITFCLGVQPSALFCKLETQPFLLDNFTPALKVPFRKSHGDCRQKSETTPKRRRDHKRDTRLNKEPSDSPVTVYQLS